jgi:hypothetical protein
MTTASTEMTTIELSRDAVLVVSGALVRHQLADVVLPQLRTADRITITHCQRRQLGDIVGTYVRGGVSAAYGFTAADLDDVRGHFTGFSNAVVIRTSERRHVSDHTVAVRVYFRFPDGGEQSTEVVDAEVADYPVGMVVLAGTTAPKAPFTIQPS